MREVFKIIIIVLAVLLIVSGVTAVVLFGDAVSYTATGSETLSPTGAAVGKALVVYNPGLPGGAKDAASKIAVGLQSNGYMVVLAGVRSAVAGNTSGYDAIVVGGPIYAGKPVGSIQGYLNGLNPMLSGEVSRNHLFSVLTHLMFYYAMAILFRIFNKLIAKRHRFRSGQWRQCLSQKGIDKRRPVSFDRFPKGMRPLPLQ
jgi:hypothetical protein